MAYTKTYHGVSILIHSPQEYPQNAVARTIGQIGTDVTINVVPSVIVTEESVRGLPLTQRNCYFKDEVNRSYYKIFDFLNNSNNFFTGKTSHNN